MGGPGWVWEAGGGRQEMGSGQRVEWKGERERATLKEFWSIVGDAAPRRPGRRASPPNTAQPTDRTPTELLTCSRDAVNALH